MAQAGVAEPVCAGVQRDARRNRAREHLQHERERCLDGVGCLIHGLCQAADAHTHGPPAGELGTAQWGGNMLPAHSMRAALDADAGHGGKITEKHTSSSGRNYSGSTGFLPGWAGWPARLGCCYGSCFARSCLRHLLWSWTSCSSAHMSSAASTHPLHQNISHPALVWRGTLCGQASVACSAAGSTLVS